MGQDVERGGSQVCEFEFWHSSLSWDLSFTKLVSSSSGCEFFQNYNMPYFYSHFIFVQTLYFYQTNLDHIFSCRCINIDVYSVLFCTQRHNIVIFELQETDFELKCTWKHLMSMRNQGFVHYQRALLLISFSTDLTGDTCTRLNKQSFSLRTYNLYKEV